MTLLITSCSQADPKIMLAQIFLDSFDKGNIKIRKEIVSDPTRVDELFESTRKNNSKLDRSYEIIGVTSGGVNVKFLKDCHSDIVSTIVTTEIDGQLKIDLKATYLGLLTSGNREKTRKYCYEFIDKPLQGKLRNQPWQARHAYLDEYEFADSTEEQLLIAAETCTDKLCTSVLSPKILTKLDLRYDGGNFDGENYIMVIREGGGTIMYEGSYRLSPTADGKTKLEISLDNDENNSVSGYVVF